MAPATCFFSCSASRGNSTSPQIPASIAWRSSTLSSVPASNSPDTAGHCRRSSSKTSHPPRPPIFSATRIRLMVCCLHNSIPSAIVSHWNISYPSSNRRTRAEYVVSSAMSRMGCFMHLSLSNNLAIFTSSPYHQALCKARNRRQKNRSIPLTSE